METIAARTQNSGGQLPLDAFEKMLGDRKANPYARRLAFVILRQADAKRAEKLVPGLLLDPSADLRREAVAKLIDAASQAEEDKDRKKAAKLYQTALSGAVEDDQVKAIVAPLKKLGVKVDLQKHFGFLTAWSVPTGEASTFVMSWT